MLDAKVQFDFLINLSDADLSLRTDAEVCICCPCHPAVPMATSTRPAPDPL